MTQEQILAAFRALNEELAREGIKGEVGVVGGAAMALVFNAREATRDVDAVFEPATRLRDVAVRVARALKLPEDWLNDAAKGFMPPDTQPRRILLDLPNLSVWVPPLGYLLAMKAIAARLDSHDADDLRTLIRHMQLTRVEDVLKAVEGYYPRNQIPARTQFFLEELFEGMPEA
ncbi:MAG: hypothetical protein M3Y79_08960 [Pseudomonadota bacterium]|nr:hypothetical protein [Pseudomonadota bacterium]